MDQTAKTAEAKARISEMIGALATFYPSTEVTTKNHKAFATALCDIPLDVLQAAIDQCIAELKFFPSVADIRERARILTSPAMPPALEAWATVVKEIGRVGIYRSPHFDDPIIDRAVNAIGWKELCNSENQVADRAHFAKIYDQLVIRAEADARLLPKARELRALTSAPVIAQIASTPANVSLLQRERPEGGSMAARTDRGKPDRARRSR